MISDSTVGHHTSIAGVAVESGPAAAVVVKAPEELDVASRQACFLAMTADRGSHVVLDLTRTTFMDCGGYQAIVAARNSLCGTGSSLELTGATGQPDRLLSLITELQAA